MYISDDFTNKEIELSEGTENLSEEYRAKYQSIADLYFQIIELEKSQYIELTDKDFIYKLKTEIYEEIKEAANLTHGKSKIELDESKGVCYITLYTKFIFLNDSFGISATRASELLKLATWSKISIEDELIKVQFMFDISINI